MHRTIIYTEQYNYAPVVLDDDSAKDYVSWSYRDDATFESYVEVMVEYLYQRTESNIHGYMHQVIPELVGSVEHIAFNLMQVERP